MLVGVTNYLIIYIQFYSLSPRHNFDLSMSPPMINTIRYPVFANGSEY